MSEPKAPAASAGTSGPWKSSLSRPTRSVARPRARPERGWSRAIPPSSKARTVPTRPLQSLRGGHARSRLRRRRAGARTRGRALAERPRPKIAPSVGVTMSLDPWRDRLAAVLERAAAPTSLHQDGDRQTRALGRVGSDTPRRRAAARRTRAHRRPCLLRAASSPCDAPGGRARGEGVLEPRHLGVG